VATRPGKLVVIVGQTASGKSALAMDLALKFKGEIICADSRTVYKGMDIGTAKPSKEDRKLVKHHLLDVVKPDQRFTAADFKQGATKAIDAIVAADKLPIMVGGTGLYIDAVLYDFGFSDGAGRDPENPRHAAKGSGSSKPLRENTLIIGLEIDQETLRERIEKRVEHMVEEDFVEEVNSLLDKYGEDESAFNAPGYRPFIKHLNGQLSLEEAKQKFIQNDMQLAKKQKTWFKRNKSIHWASSSLEAVALTTTFLGKD
jgi:tRNA dimethylallyltransferase